MQCKPHTPHGTHLTRFYCSFNDKQMRETNQAAIPSFRRPQTAVSQFSTKYLADSQSSTSTKGLQPPNNATAHRTDSQAHKPANTIHTRATTPEDSACLPLERQVLTTWQKSATRTHTVGGWGQGTQHHSTGAPSTLIHRPPTANQTSQSSSHPSAAGL